jgi:hypothetical protein
VLGGRIRDLVPRGEELPWFYGKLKGRLSRA